MEYPGPTEEHVPFILASSSPRRTKLLQLIGAVFTVSAVSVDEAVLAGEPPWITARRLAYRKLAAAVRANPGAPVLAADTVVELDGRALGKPADTADASRMLRALRGRDHTVHTAVAVHSAGFTGRLVASARVTMRDYSDSELTTYAETGAPLDKAGGYGIQDAAFRPVEQVTGCVSTVMGLPVHPAARLLRAAGLLPPDAEAPADMPELPPACRTLRGTT